MARAYPIWAPPLLALQFLTRLPVPIAARLSEGQARAGLLHAAAWFPLIGASIGAITAGIALAAALVWPVYIAALMALACEALFTGALHEDAVADFCDAFGGGRDAAHVHQILKDSRIGSYGGVGLFLALGLRAASLTALLATRPPLIAALAIVAAATSGRLLIVALMATTPPAPAGSGIAKDLSDNTNMRMLVPALLASAPGIAGFAALQPLRATAALAASLLLLAGLRQFLLRRLGGSTGDCFGTMAYGGQLLWLLAAAAG